MSDLDTRIKEQIKFDTQRAALTCFTICNNAED